MTAADRLDEIQARADAAGDGPWEAIPNDRAVGIAHVVIPESMHPTAWPNDAEFIAHARTDVPALVAALRAVLTECDKAEAIGVQGAYDHGCRDQVRWIRRAVEAALGAES